MQTPLSKLAATYLTEKIKRGDLARASAKMPRNALRSLCVSFGNRPVNQLGETAIGRWLETIAHHAPATRRNELGAVRQFCGWMLKKRHLRVNPCDDLPKIRQPRRVVHVVDRPAIASLYAVCETTRDRLLVDLMFILGLRCVDSSRLNVEDWDRYRKTLTVTGKGGHERTLPVPEQVERSLREWVATDPRTSGPLFPTWSGRLKPATISGRISKLMKDAGVKASAYDGMSAHALRRTAATETLERSGNLRAVQNLLGHADLSSMKHYLAAAGVGEIAAALQTRFDPSAA